MDEIRRAALFRRWAPAGPPQPETRYTARVRSSRKDARGGQPNSPSTTSPSTWRRGAPEADGAVSMTDINPVATIRELGAALRSGATTPTELAKLYLARLDGVGRQLNAVVTLTEERALREARQAEAELAAG